MLVIVTPGQDTAITIRNAASGGRERGMLTACGVVTGQLVWTLAVAVGIAALLTASQGAFELLKLVGAGYLVYLGIQSLLHAFRGGGPLMVDVENQVRQKWHVAYRQGLISNLSNAKAGLFFTSLLPQFVPAGTRPWGHVLALGLVFAGMTLLWLSLYSVAVDKARLLIGRPRVRRAFDGLMGSTLVALGARLATSTR